MITLDEILAAAERIGPHICRTPLVASKGLPGVWFKCENLQVTAAFKIRGGFNRILQLPDDCPGVVTHSSGNHGQAVALAAKVKGLPAVVAMLDHAVANKVERIRAHGAEVLFCGSHYSGILEAANQVVAERGFELVHPFSDPEIIAGQGTVGLEIIEDLPDVGTVVVPIGGGGLVSGLGVALKEQRPNLRLVGVEPEGAPAMHASVKAGELVQLETADTIADGLRPLHTDAANLEHVQRYVDDIVLVSDAAMLDASRWLMEEEKLVVEPSGAAAVAALREGLVDAAVGPVIAVITGGNVDPSLLMPDE